MDLVSIVGDERVTDSFSFFWSAFVCLGQVTIRQDNDSIVMLPGGQVENTI